MRLKIDTTAAGDASPKARLAVSEQYRHMPGAEPARIGPKPKCHKPPGRGTKGVKAKVKSQK